MSLRLRNKWHYKGKGLWDWEVFLDDNGSGELSRVDYVEYILHPTFPVPIRKVVERRKGFVFRAEGWGAFELKAFVYKKDGTKIKLTHFLELSADPEKGVSN